MRKSIEKTAGRGKMSAGLTFLCCALLALPATAVERHVEPGQPLQAALDKAAAGDTLVLAPGIYRGNFVIRTPVSLYGENGARLECNRTQYCLRIEAPDVRIENLQLADWGANLSTLDAGIFVTREAARVHIAGNRLQGDSFGIWVDATPDARIEHNRISGNPAIRSQDRGNGIQLFNVSGAEVIGNEVWQTRDGIYIDTSNDNRLVDNHLHDLRYGIHYMYSHHNALIGNRTQNTRTGYALMQSKYLTVTGNRSDGDLNYGFLLNYITHSTLRGNRIGGVRAGRSGPGGQGSAVAGADGKAIFIYNALFNEITDNLFADSDLGIHLTAGSEDNRLSGNAFIGNREQVKYVATREQNWSHAGSGNYWSDYLGWDLNGDGIGDTRYEPNDGVDRLLWQYPDARVLFNSPAVEVLRWVQRQFPVLKAPGVIDSHPLMSSHWLEDLQSQAASQNPRKPEDRNEYRRTAQR